MHSIVLLAVQTSNYLSFLTPVEHTFDEVLALGRHLRQQIVDKLIVDLRKGDSHR